VPGGAADRDQRLRSNDEILFCDGVCVINASHHKVVQLMGAAAVRGHVSLGIRRRIAPYTGNITQRIAPYAGYITQNDPLYMLYNTENSPLYR